MRFLILNTDYPEFLSWLYAHHAGLEQQPYEMQMQARVESLFGVADFYSRNLRELGHEAWDIHANNEWMQRAWAKEHGIAVEAPALALRQRRALLQRIYHVITDTPLRYVKPVLRPVLRSIWRSMWRTVDHEASWFYAILAAQIEHYRPDVLLNQAMDGIAADFLREMKPNVRLLIGQHAAMKLSDAEDLSCYDLAISSFSPTVEFFKEKGLRAALHRLGFEPRVLSSLAGDLPPHGVTFIGSLHAVHSSRAKLLETICSRFPETRIWGPSVASLPPESSIRGCYVGQVWGREMYHVLARSKLTLNHHGDVAPFANNMRLYEATGAGTLLITDWKANLPEMFEPGKEVVTYNSADECADLVQYYLQHEAERAAITRAGQARTLREHTYYHRMRELVGLVGKLC